MPFAAARALTWTAQDAQKEIQRELPQRFIIRNSFVQKGVRIKAATKSNLQATIFDKDDFMTLQETGGTKTPRGRHLAIPTNNVKRNKYDIIRGPQRPRKLVDRGGHFIGTPKGSHSKILGLWQRPSNKERRAMYKSNKREQWAPARLLYAFESSAAIKPRFDFLPTIRQTVDKRLERNFQLSLADALK